MISVKKADKRDITNLSRKLSMFLEDKSSKVYQDNIAKFGIPEEYVKKALAEEKLLKAMSSGKATFYVAIEDNEMIGFAQIIQQNDQVTELDRIVVFPLHEGKGVGTQLLHKVIDDCRKKGVNTITTNVGKNETHARKFYEKNDFRFRTEIAVDAPWGKKIDLAVYELSLRPY
ncbi:MAG: GNAT family N-acetyltransferase [Candidatus Hodarchaeota archaeon]